MWIWWLCAAFGADEGTSPAPAVRVEPMADGSVKLVPDRQVPGDATQASAVLLEFGEISLYDLTRYFADLLRKNFLVGDRKALEAKKVQFIGHDTMSVDEAWEAYRSALRAHGFTAVPSGDMITLVASADAARGAVAVGEGSPASTLATVTRLLPVRDAKAADLVTVVRPLLSADAQLFAYVPGNTLIVTDTGDNVRKVAELVEKLNVAAPASHLELIHLEHAIASEVRSVVEALYPVVEAKEAPTTKGRRPKRPQKDAPTEAGSAGVESRFISKVLDDARTNTLIVLANPQGHAAVAEVVAELDVEVDAREHSSLHVVRLKYAMAEEVAAVLAGLQEDSPEKPPRRAVPGTKGAKADADDGDLDDALDGSARIAADPATNSLVVVAEAREFAPIADLIAQLDVVRGQVFVDAVFVELTHTDGKELSLGAHVLPSEGQPVAAATSLDGDVSSLNVSPALLSGLAAGVFGPLIEVLGPDGALTSVPTFGIALRALQTHDDVQVMGNPALLALDHEEGTLSVGRRIPYRTSTTTTAVGLPLESYDRLDVNMDLVVTPHINDTDLVTLDISLSVDEVDGAAATNEGGGPPTSGRSLTSRVQVEDGQTIVIAGMTGTKVEVGERKVPILGDIPLLGALFRSRSSFSRNTNLMVFLTPHVVEHPSDLLAIRAMKEAQRAEFVRRFQGKTGEAWLEELNALIDAAGARAGT